MAYLIFILVSLVFFAGFYALTSIEARRGVRVYAERRERLDRSVERLTFIWKHVDLGAFLKDEMRRVITRIAHDSVYLSLQTVRSVERVLTRIAKSFRAQHVSTDRAPRESTRTFLKTLTDFKDRLQATHPDVPEMPIEVK